MKIRRKIALIFTGLTSIVLLCAFTFIYGLTEHYKKADFYSRLQEKAFFIAQEYFEKDELNQNMYTEMMDKNAKSMPEAHEIILDTKNPRLVYDSLQHILPKHVIKYLLAGNNISFQQNERQGVALYYVDNQGTFIVMVIANDKIGHRKQQNLLEVLLFIFLGSIIFIYFMGKYYARKVLSPVGEILKNVKKINATNLKLRLEETDSKDELAELIKMMNLMLGRLEYAFDMQKTFISNASHELKNPLTAIMGETEITLAKKRKIEEYIDSLTKIGMEADRLNLLIKNLLCLAQADSDVVEAKQEKMCLDELLEEIKDSLEKTDYKGRVEFRFGSQRQLFCIVGIHELLKIALSNLIDNACKFSGDELVDVFLRGDDDEILLTISDKGIGIPDDEINNIFQPFYRASNVVSYKGTGIGLALAQKIITLHNGKILFTRNEGLGTKVQIRFSRKSVFDV
ncbi:MAG: HAMP domain-containing sensor histidine kinase [Paludibacteraceae bacterium]|nr:HAMP domain-containing sensor histidine kinase [Paludibacteraceae bacterium]